MNDGLSAPLPQTYLVCGVPISALTPETAPKWLIGRMRHGLKTTIHLCNAYTLSLVDQDLRLRDCLLSADANLPDGAPVAWLGGRLGSRRPVRGPEFMRDVITRSQDLGITHYFLGGAPGVAERAVDNLRRLAPRLAEVGVESPPCKDMANEAWEATVQRINDSGAGIVWVGLGTPKQDHVVPLLAQSSAQAIIPVGAAFDFWAGTVRRAPRWMQGTGTEWLFRLAVEPKRLWRRYLLGNPRFIRAVIRHRRRRGD